MTTILAIFVLTIVLFVFWGVGAAVQRLTGSRSGPWPVSIGIGLAATIAAGGLLNLAHIAYGPVLWTLAGGELVVSAFEMRRVQWKLDCDKSTAVEIVSAAFVIGLVTVFAICTQLPPRAFNSHDDFENYFVYPVRMLATGTLSGSPLSGLGSVAFGGEAFLHGFVLSVLPIGYINGVDAVFGLAGLMLLTATAGWKRFSWFPGAMLGPLLVATINPQFVNVSALYSGALLIATAVLLVGDDREAGFPSALIIGLVYASMTALKPTFAIFAACHLPFAALAIRTEQRPWMSALKWCGKTVAWASLFVAPWIVLHIPNYLGPRSLPQAAVPNGFDGELNLLSAAKLFYGDSFFHYTAIVLVAVAIMMLGLAAWRFETEPRKRKMLLGIVGGAGSGVLSYLVAVVVLGKATYGYAPNLRYAIPFLLGACITSLVMSPSVRGKCKPKFFFYFPLLAALAICAVFLPSMVGRYRQAARFGSILAFSDLADSAGYQTYTAFWLSAEGKQYIMGLQDKVPPGEPLLAWINTPFLLDYKRNAIVDADTVGIATPWARVPSNIHYVLWQYRGPEVRRQGDYVTAMHGPGYRERLVAARSLAFATHLSQVSQSSEVIASDGAFVLFRIHEPL